MILSYFYNSNLIERLAQLQINKNIFTIFASNKQK